MQVIRYFIPGSLENYNHIIYDPESRQAMVIDPFDAESALAVATEHHLELKAIYLTHEHGDHIRGTPALLSQLPGKTAPVYGISGVKGVTHPVQDQAVLAVGTKEIMVLFTPGHTALHSCLYYSGAEPFLICGDTLFNAGVGNVRSGSARTLCQTVDRLCQLLPPECRIFPGHDYLLNNLRFALSQDPGNQEVQELLENQQSLSPDDRLVTTMAIEHSINLFFPPDIPLPEVQRQQRFSALRSQRDEW